MKRLISLRYFRLERSKETNKNSLLCFHSLWTWKFAHVFRDSVSRKVSNRDGLFGSNCWMLRYPVYAYWPLGMVCCVWHEPRGTRVAALQRKMNLQIVSFAYNSVQVFITMSIWVVYCFWNLFCKSISNGSLNFRDMFDFILTFSK